MPDENTAPAAEPVKSIFQAIKARFLDLLGISSTTDHFVTLLAKPEADKEQKRRDDLVVAAHAKILELESFSKRVQPTIKPQFNRSGEKVSEPTYDADSLKAIKNYEEWGGKIQKALDTAVFSIDFTSLTQLMKDVQNVKAPGGDKKQD